MTKVLSIVLGGGKGERLFPLTKERAKPAVPFGGKYRLVDIPISSSIHSGFKQIYILTQFNSASLHNHISNTYIFDTFTQGFVEILAAEQTYEHTGWYEGTADAVRKNLFHFRDHRPDYYIILSGDQLYRMDLEDFFHNHLTTGADISVAVTPVSKEKTRHFGILQVDKKGRIVRFVEKPPPDQDISELEIPETLAASIEGLSPERRYLASMGIYVFSAAALHQALDNHFTDFGKEIIPNSIQTAKVQSYIFTGYWEDIGTIRSFYNTNISLTTIRPEFDFYKESFPIYTRRRDLPASKINSCIITQCLTADGCIITNANVMHSIIGIRTVIESGASLDGVVCMGADYYESPEDKQHNREQNIPDIGIGKGSLIRGAIIDKNARIGEFCRIGVDSLERPDGDYCCYHVRDGIIVIPKNAVVPSGTVV
ncbi:MAG: glucose-1-phosphate adenylyltransferase [Spirochaetales bacterium]|nr:glucose-1-phosphate adenylyltransferase [Spirochaetales bacterium]